MTTMFKHDEECQCLRRSKYNDIRRLKFRDVNRLKLTVTQERDMIDRMRIGESHDYISIEKPVPIIPPWMHWGKPVCLICKRAQLHVGRIVGGQQWATCAHCGFIGDPVDYCAAILEVNLEKALFRLAEKFKWENFQSATARQWRTKMEEHHERSGIIESETRCLMLPWAVEELRECWRYFGTREGIGGQVNFLDHKDVESWIYPRLCRDDKLVCNTSPRRTFQGSDWGEIEVIPLRDAPNHITGLLIRGATPEKSGEQMLRLFPSPGCPATDPGMIIRKELLESPPGENRTIIMCHHDLDEFFQLQLRHQREMSHLPSMAFWFLDWPGHPNLRTQNWFWLKGNKLVFWMPKWDKRVFREAALADGYISAIYPERDISIPFPEIDPLKHRFRAAATLKIIGNCADYWGDFLYRVAGYRTNVDMKLLAEFGLPDHIYQKWRGEYVELYET